MSKQPNHLDRSSGVALEPTVPVKKQAPNIRQESTPLPLDLVIRNSRQKQTTHRPSTVKQLDTVTQSSLPVAPNPHSTQANASLSQIEPEEAVHDASPDPAVYHHHWLSLEESDLKKSDRIKMINDFLVSPERIPILVARLNEAAEDDRPPIDDDEQRFGNVNVDEMSDSTKKDYEQCPKMTVALSTMDMNCHICTKPIAQVAVMQPCHHTFCTVCALEWFKYCPKCPDCRRPIESVALNIENVSTYDSFPESFPYETNNYTGPSIKAAMLQFLAVHYEQFPELGYPPPKLDFGIINSITESVLSLKLRRQLFRRLVYMHNYDNVTKYSLVRDHPPTYYIQVPGRVKRLFVFIKKEFKSLSYLLKMFPPIEEYFAFFRFILTTYPIGSFECLEQFEIHFQEYCGLSYDISTSILHKMFFEMKMYAKSPIEDYHEYIETLAYRKNEVLGLNHLGRNVRQHLVEKQLQAANETSEVSTEDDVEFIGVFDNPKPRRALKSKPKPPIVPQGASELPLEGPQPASEAVKRPLEHVALSRVARRRNTLDGREGAPAWTHLLPPSRSRNNSQPAPISAEAHRQRLLKRQKELRIRRAGYSRKEIQNMRRTIRKSVNSPVYYRELMSEVRGWFAGMESILNAYEFSRQLKSYFTDMASADDYFKLIPKPMIKKESMTGAMLENELFKDQMATFKANNKLEEPKEIKREPGDQSETSVTPSDGELAQSGAQLEGGSGDNQVESQQDDAAIKEMNQYKQISTKEFLMQIDKANKKIYYINNVYNSDSD